VCEYDLHTQLAVMRKRKATGFVGWITYELNGKENEWSKVTIILAKYIEYANGKETKQEYTEKQSSLRLLEGKQEIWKHLKLE